MKSKIFLLMTSALIAIAMNAQNDAGTKTWTSADTLRWQTNQNIFDPYARANNFQEAYPTWKETYDECPSFHLNLYIHGAKIINWQISNETDQAKIEALIEDLMTLYDNRIKFFGDHPSKRKDRIIAEKAGDYNQLKGEKTDYALIYKWTGEAIEDFGNSTNAVAISLYMFASLKLMQNDMEQYKAQYVADFLKCSELFNAQIEAAKAANNATEEENILKHKTDLEKTFASSGAADCDILQSIYATKIEENKDNIEFLKETLILLQRVNCTEIDAFLAASEYAHIIAPTAASAQGLGHKAYREKDNEAAEKYYTQAIELSDDPEVKAALYYNLATIAFNQNSMVKAKQLSLKSIGENPNYGKSYILIGRCYADAKNFYPDDPVLSQLVYIAAVDKFERARQVDPSIADEARKLIATYSQYFPTGGDIFMHPSIKEGENYTIGGWIGETVKVRAAK